MIARSGINAAPLNGTERLGLSQPVTGPCRQAVRARLFQAGWAAAPVQAQALYAGRAGLALRASAGATVASGVARASLRARSVALGGVQTPPGAVWASVRQSVSVSPVDPGQPAPAGSVGGSFHRWCVQARTDATALQVTGTVTISAEENGARAASLTVRGPATAQAGQTLTLTLAVDAAQSLLYRGRIVRAQFSPDTDTTALSCSDGLQSLADRLSRAQIDHLTPGAISPPGASTLGYAYLMARLSTVPMSAVVRADGVLAIVPWSASASSRTLNRLLHGSFSLERAAAEDATASGGSGSAGGAAPAIRRKGWDLTLELSWIRAARMRYSSGWWAGEVDLCKWLDHWPLPDEDTVRRAVEGCGWTVDSLSVGKMVLRPGWVTCNDSTFGLLIAPGTTPPAVAAQWQLSKRYTRTMKATCTLQLRERGTRPGDPVDVTTLRLSVKDPRDGRDWMDYGAGVTALQTDANGDDYADLIDLREAGVQFGTPLQDAQASISSALQGVAVTIAQAATQLTQSRRRSTASATTLIDPTLDIGQTLTLEHPKLAFTGVVTRVTHTLDTQRGSALTEVQVAQVETPPAQDPPPGWPAGSVHAVIPGNWTGGFVAAALQRAAQVATRDASAPLPKAAQTRIGGTQAMLPDDPSLDPLFQGWVANRAQSRLVQGGGPVSFYPEYPSTGFFVRSPDITLPDQDTAIDLGSALLIL